MLHSSLHSFRGKPLRGIADCRVWLCLLLVACSNELDSDPNGGAGASGSAGNSNAGGAMNVGGADNAGNSGSGGTVGDAGNDDGGSGGNQGGNAGNGGNNGSGGTDSGGNGGGGTAGSNSGGGGSNAGSGGMSGNAGSAGSGGETDPGEPAVRFIGRMDTSDVAGPRFAWSGSAIAARFSGTSVGVRLSGGQEYTVVLDGTLRPKIAPGDGVTPIASGLASGEHVVELYRRTEAHGGESQFLGFDFGAGELLPPPPAATRRIEVIGDSITCGYGNEGTFPCSFTYDTENHYLSYSAIAARAVDADLITIAWSGRGIVCNYGDDPCADALPSIYDRTLPNRNDSAWDFSWQPDVVVINLGTNDFSTAIDPTHQEFVNAYVAFLQHLRSQYPNATILCTCGPMLGGAELQQARSGIADAIAELNDPKVKSFTLEPQTGDVGCDYHPSVATHQAVAEVLIDVLHDELGW